MFLDKSYKHDVSGQFPTKKSFVSCSCKKFWVFSGVNPHMHIIKDISKTIQDRDLILVSFDSPDHSIHFRALICQNWTIFRKFAFFQDFAHLLRAHRVSPWPIFSNFFLVTQDTIRDQLVKKSACYKFWPRFSAFWSISPLLLTETRYRPSKLAKFVDFGQNGLKVRVTNWDLLEKSVLTILDG